MKNKKISIVGTVGVPANYGGFETLVENLVIGADDVFNDCSLYVYCSRQAYRERPKRFGQASLFYIPLPANGPLSILYDMACILHASITKADVILLLGHGGSFIIPFVKFFTKAKFITNIDGIEWRREKWSPFARFILRYSERCAIKFSDAIISDNDAIKEYVCEHHNADSVVIAYGGDHAVTINEESFSELNLPERYFLSLCRIEPENNVHLILEAFVGLRENIVFIGNWDRSEYGKSIKEKFERESNIYLIDPIYNLGILKFIRKKSICYIHGHSAGGTNPSLVEFMHFGLPIIAYDCLFNVYSTHGEAIYFSSSLDLSNAVKCLTPEIERKVGGEMIRIARSVYSWHKIRKAYRKLINDVVEN